MSRDGDGRNCGQSEVAGESRPPPVGDLSIGRGSAAGDFLGLTDRLGANRLPTDGEVLAMPESFEPVGNAVLEPAQGGLSAGFNAQQQRVVIGLQHALALAEADNASGVRPIDVPYRRGRLPAMA